MAISNEERIARPEAGYEHLATKAEVAEVRTDIAATRTNSRANPSAVRTYSDPDLAASQADTNRRIDRLFWAVIGIGGGLLAVAATALIRDALA